MDNQKEIPLLMKVPVLIDPGSDPNPQNLGGGAEGNRFLIHARLLERGRSLFPKRLDLFWERTLLLCRGIDIGDPLTADTFGRRTAVTGAAGKEKDEDDEDFPIHSTTLFGRFWFFGKELFE